MMNIFPPSGPVRVGDIANIPFYCSEPGTVDFTSSDPTVATVASTLLVPGTRVYRSNNQNRTDGFFAPSATGDLLKVRHSVTMGFEFDLSALENAVHLGGISAGEQCMIARNYLASPRSVYQISWGLVARHSDIYFEANPTNDMTTTSGTVLLLVPSLSTDPYNKNIIRVTFVLPASGTTVARRYKIDAGSIVSGNLTLGIALAGEFADAAITVFKNCRRYFFAATELSSAQQDLFLDGGMPSDACVVKYALNEETGIAYDSSANGYDGVSDLESTYYRASQIVRTYTDTITVEPYQAIAVNALKTGTTTITARRRRQGIPYRTPALPDAEVYEDTTYLLTVTDALASEQSTVQLMIYADRDGTATISMDNPIIDFPASVSVVLGKNQISGLVTGAGTCNVTVEMNGTSDVTTFVIDGITVSLSVGPDIDFGAESFPITKQLRIYSNFDDVVDIVSSNENIHVPDTAIVVGGIAEIDVVFDNESTGIITVTNDYLISAIANVNVYNNPFLVKIGPSQNVLRGDSDLTVYLIVVSDTVGTVALESSDVNLEVPATVVIGDDLFAVIECVAVGGCVATVTATKGIRGGSCVLTVNQSAEASPVPTKGTSHNLPLGEDHEGRNINRLSLPNMEDVDWSVFDWLKTMDVSVEGSPELGGFKQVPVIWVGTERSFQSKVYKELRDISGSLNPPYITVSRKGVKKDLNKKGQHWANVPAVYDYLQGVLPIRREIRHDKTAQFMNNNAKRRTGKSSYKFDENPTETKPVYEVTYVPIPVYLTFEYEIKIWTSYRSQMNTIEQKLLTYVPAGNINRFVLSHDGHYFEGFLGEDVVESGNVDAIEKEERKFETTFTLEVLGHVAGEEQNQNSPYIAKRETAAETVLDIELGE